MCCRVRMMNVCCIVNFGISDLSGILFACGISVIGVVCIIVFVFVF